MTNPLVILAVIGFYLSLVFNSKLDGMKRAGYAAAEASRSSQIFPCVFLLLFPSGFCKCRVSSSTKPQVCIPICRVYSHIPYTSPHYPDGHADGLGKDGGLRAVVWTKSLKKRLRISCGGSGEAGRGEDRFCKQVCDKEMWVKGRGNLPPY